MDSAIDFLTDYAISFADKISRIALFSTRFGPALEWNDPRNEENGQMILFL